MSTTPMRALVLPTVHEQPQSPAAARAGSRRARAVQLLPLSAARTPQYTTPTNDAVAVAVLVTFCRP